MGRGAAAGSCAFSDLRAERRGREMPHGIPGEPLCQPSGGDGGVTAAGQLMTWLTQSRDWS